MAPPGAAPEGLSLVSGARRSWLWGGRPEPFAVCLSVRGRREHVEDLLRRVDAAFHATVRRSLTSGLIRSLLSLHAGLREINQDLPPEEWTCASAVAAALRPSGLYVAQAGEALVGSTRLGTVWARSWEPDEEEAAAAVLLGGENAPTITTEYFELEEGDAVLLLPGLVGHEANEEALAAALESRPDLGAISTLLEPASPDSNGLVVWCPPAQASAAAVVAPWSAWSTAPAPRVPMPPPAASDRAGVSRRRWWALGVAALAVIAAFGVLAVVSRVAPDTTVAEANSLVQQAQSTPDQTRAARLLNDAVAMLQAKADRNADAHDALIQAQAARDRRLDIVRVGGVEAFPLPAADTHRPVGLWKSDGDLLVLDLGAQMLYQMDEQGSRMGALLKPGDVYAGQPVGTLVAAAWSPPIGSDSEGRFLVIDNSRSIISIEPSGVRRWSPPDSDQWDRLGPAAATFDDLYLLDAGRSTVWRYPARVALARSTVAVSPQDEPRLSQAMDLAAGGDLFVLLPDGIIHRVAPGAGPLPFDGAVPGQALANAVALYAHPDLDRVWALEPSAARVVEFTVDGHYARQYVFPTDAIRNGVSLEVDAAGGKLRILTPDYIVTAPMNPA
ncbi:MAG TPA: hypothetical protein VGK54_05650 [Chloroflexota bacterium]